MLTKQEALSKIDELKQYVDGMDISKAQRLINKYGKFVYGNKAIVADKGYIKVPLPSANTCWTLDAYEYVKNVCDGEEEDMAIYPVQYYTNENTDWLYIHVY